jgi:hypothetical protein
MSDKNINFDREDNEAIGDATRRQWDAISHVLHLPALDRLADNAEQLQVTNRIGDLVNRTRGGAINAAQLTGQLNEQFTQERNSRAPSTPEGTTARTMEQQQLAIAESWLQVIYRNVERQDITQLISDMPASIRPVPGSPTMSPDEWRVSGVTIDGAPRDIRIDLSNPIWRAGTKEQILTRITDTTVGQAGIRIMSTPPVTASHTLSNAEATDILDSKADVIDPKLPLNSVALPSQTIAGVPTTVTVDLPRLFRHHPTTAGMNRAALATYLSTLSQDEYSDIVTGVNDGTGAAVDVDPVTTATQVVNRVYAALGRTATQPIASKESKLNDAIDSRQPIDDLLESTADNRELLLALSTIQRDPSAANANDNTIARNLLNAREKLTNEKTLRDAIESLKTLSKPSKTITALEGEIAILAAGGKKNDNQVSRLDKEKEDSKKVLSAMQQILTIVDSSISSLTAQLRPTAGMALHGYSTASLEGDIIAASHFDPTHIASEIERVFNATPAGANKGQILESAEHYNQEITKNAESIRDAGGESEKNGSEKAWAIVRRGLENQGVRGEQLEKSIQYMKNQLDHTPESARDVEELTNSVYDYVGEAENGQGFAGWRGKGADGEPTPAAEWQEDKSYRTLKTLGLWKHKPSLREYKNRLFTQQNIGITLAQADTAMSRSIPMPRLIDSYFRVKYLSELPASDPRRLPDDSQETVELLRKLHKAILERAQLSFHNATAATEAEMEQLGIKKDMTKLERLQAAQSFLLNEKDTYFAQNKATMDKVIDRAYRPIRMRLERHDKWKEAWKGNGPWYNPVGWPVNGAKFAGGQAKALATGNGSVYNPVTYPARAVKGTTRGLISFLKMEV